MFLRDKADDYYMQNDFRKFYFTCNKLNTAVKSLKILRNAKFDVINYFFEKEKKILMTYYLEKSRK